MPGLPHFLNSKAATKFYEPYYQNLFEVTVLPPATVSGGSILIEHVNKISGLNQDRGTEIITQKFKFAERNYASGVPTGTSTDLKVEFSMNFNDANEFYVYKTLRDWWRLVYNPLTGEQGLKKDYIGTVVVTNFNRKGDIWWQRTFYNCIPMSDIPELTHDYSGGETQAIEFGWKSDYWSENIV